MKSRLFSNFLPLSSVDNHQHSWISQATKLIDIPITRRKLLTVPVAAAIVIAPKPGLANANEKKLHERLRFSLSEDRKVATIVLMSHEFENDDDQDEAEQILNEKTWTLRVESFGPDAVFELEPSRPVGHKTEELDNAVLRVNQVAYGRNPYGRIDFLFSSRMETSGVRWRLSAKTNIWASKHSKSDSTEFVTLSHSNAKNALLFSEFLDSKKPQRLTGLHDAKSIKTALGRVFNGLLQLVRYPGQLKDSRPLGKVRVSVSHNIEWIIESGTSAWLRPVVAELSCNSIKISNVVNTHSANSPVQTLAVPQELIPWRNVSPPFDQNDSKEIPYGIKGLHLHLHDKVDQQDETLDTEFFFEGNDSVSSCALRSMSVNRLNNGQYRDVRAEAVIAGNWNFTVSTDHVGEGQIIAGPFKDIDGVITRSNTVPLRSRKTGVELEREELSFAGAARIDAIAGTGKRGLKRVSTPIGSMKVFGVTPPKKPTVEFPHEDNKKKDKEIKTDLGGNPAAEIDDCKPIDRKAELKKAPLSKAVANCAPKDREYSDYVLYPFDGYQGSPIWLTSHGTHFNIGKDHKRSVNWVEMTWLLRESSLGLADASFSKLTFELTEIVMIYQPTPTSSLPRNYIWLSPRRTKKNGESIPLARIDASGAKLTASRHRDLLSLNFSFSGLFLLVDERARLVPEGASCGIFEQPGTEQSEFRQSSSSGVDDGADESKRLRVLDIVDSRPLLIVEFPPQHLLEKAFFKPGLPPSPDVTFPNIPLNDLAPYLLCKFGDGSGDVQISHHKIEPDIANPANACAGSMQAFVLDVRDPNEIVSHLLLVEKASDRALIREKIQLVKRSIPVTIDNKEGGGKWREELPLGSSLRIQADAQIARFEAHKDDFEKRVTSAINLKLKRKNKKKKTPLKESVEDIFKTALDQKIYIGPFGMDPDVAAVNRAIVQRKSEEFVTSILADTVREVAFQLSKLIENYKSKLERGETAYDPALQSAIATRVATSGAKPKLAMLPIEFYLESQVPTYQLFRTFYRNNLLSTISGDALVDENTKDRIEFVFLDISVENPSNDDWLKKVDSYTIPYDKFTGFDPKKDLTESLTAFTNALKGNQQFENVVEARLANPARLAFRINCRDGLVDARNAANTPNAKERKHTGFNALHEQGVDHIPFSLAGLTDWSSMELSVVNRAERVFASQNNRRLDQYSARRVNLHGAAKLDHLGFAPNADPESRKWHVRANHIVNSLREKPTWDQTSIELPARLTLSPSQQAIFKAPNGIHPDIYADTGVNTRKPTALDCFGQPITRVRDTQSVEDQTDDLSRLWSADLVDRYGAPDADIRAVFSPDVSPDALLKLFGKHLRVGDRPAPGFGAPPRGPFAPWFLSRGQTSRAPTPPDVFVAAVPKESRGDELNDALKEIDENTVGDADGRREQKIELICDDDKKGGWRFGSSLPSMYKELCRVWTGRPGRSKTDKEKFEFLTSLDAYDRHELVLLSSAFGLPVMPREAAPGLTETSQQASQFEPDEDYLLGDVLPEQEIYRPKALNVSELSLTSLGANFAHDTSFTPPASAKFYNGENLFDALSIERWQYSTSLGRDIHCEVVYKGFLLPFGFKASLVKVTERIFSKAPNGSIKAYLRQRMFIRSADREKQFGALGQAYEGRLFPARTVRLLTENTPDIVDPTSVFADRHALPLPHEHSTGRLIFRDAPGLVFWPRTALSRRADVRFDLEMDDAFSTCPMLFVDNVAVNDAFTMKLVADYYNDSSDFEGVKSPDRSLKDDVLSPVNPTEHRRTLLVGGVKLRYAEEEKTGSASLQTDSITLRLEGRLSAKAISRASDTNKPIVELRNKRFAFDPVLQGADQPPFYPALETARIRLTQNEYLTGVSAKPVRACYDGNYIVNGFAVSEERTIKSEVFMNLIDGVTQNMGSEGARSGGVFRPSGRIKAISREKGPMALPLAYDQTNLKAGILPAYSVAMDFKAEPQDAAAQPRSIALQESMAVTQNIFADAKLLGIIEFSDIISLITDIASTQAPKLVETVQYGANTVTDSVEDTVELVRKNVIAPLTELVVTARSRWDSLDADLAQRQIERNPIKQIAPITIAELYPALDEALTEFEQALVQFNADLGNFDLTEGVEKLFQQFSVVYEKGQKLLEAIRRAASNPLERLETALQSRYKELTAEADALLELVKGKLDGLLDWVKTKLIEEVIEMVFPNPDLVARAKADAEADEVLFSVPIPGAPFFELMDLGGLPADFKQNLNLTRAEARSLLEAFLNDLVSTIDGKPDLLAKTKEQATEILETKKQYIAGELLTINTAVSARISAEIEATIEIYVVVIEHIELVVNDELDKLREEVEAEIADLDQKTTKFLTVYYEVKSYVELIKECIDLAKGIESAIQKNDLKLAVSKASDLVALGLGQSVLSLISDELAGANKQFAEFVKSVLTSIDFTQLGLVNFKVVPADPCKFKPGLTDPLEPKVVAADLEPHPSKAVGDLLPSLYVFYDGLVSDKKAWTAARVSAETELKKHIGKADFPEELIDEEALEIYLDTVDTLFASTEKLVGEIYCELVDDARRLAGLNKRIAAINADNDLFKQLNLIRAEIKSIISARKAAINRVEAHLKSLAKAVKQIHFSQLGVVLAGLVDFSKVEASVQQSVLAIAAPVANATQAVIVTLDKLLAGMEKAVADLQNFVNDKILKFADTNPFKALFVGNIITVSEFTIDYPVLASARTDIQAINDAFDKQQNQANTGLKLELLRRYFNLVTLWAEKGDSDLKRLEDIDLNLMVEALDVTDIADRAAKIIRNNVNERIVELKKTADEPVAYLLRNLKFAKLYAEFKKARASSNIPDVLRNAVFLVPLEEEGVRKDQGAFKRPDINAELTQETDRLAGDVAWLEHLSNTSKKPISDKDSFKYLSTFVNEWIEGESSPQLVFEQVGDQVKSLLRGDIDLDELFNIREQIERYLLNLIPTKYEYAYDLDFKLPKSVKSATAGVFIPGEKCELSVGVLTQIDLLPDGIPDEFDEISPSIKAKALATLGSFDIKLVGDFFDALTLKFTGARFVSDLSSESDFKLYYDDFVIGKQLEFIQSLQSYLTPKSGSGAYVQALQGQPGIEAGYELSLGTIMMGNIVFANISLNASAILPFDGGEDSRALFKAALSRRDSPFTIAYIPYGGSGFFSVTADSKGIVGFEMSLEFGGAAPFQFGPLVGEGRIMVGFYIRSMRTAKGTVSEIYATFYVGGSASIWIFSMSASLYVRLGQTAGGGMSGLAIFTFSFSMGIADFDYSIRFEKKEKKGFGGNEKSADANATLESDDEESWGVNARGANPGKKGVIENKAQCQSCDWTAYRRYFDQSLNFENI